VVHRQICPLESVVVPTNFQAHTAQAAHLKNTVYFLVIVLLFWLPPFHCVAVLRREIYAGHAASVREILAHQLLHGRDFVCPNAGCCGPASHSSCFCQYRCLPGCLRISSPRPAQHLHLSPLFARGPVLLADLHLPDLVLRRDRFAFRIAEPPAVSIFRFTFGPARKRSLGLRADSKEERKWKRRATKFDLRFRCRQTGRG